MSARPRGWLDVALGDPLTDAGPFGFVHALELDEREQFPDDAAAALDAMGVSRGYVPASLGGDLSSFEDLAITLRALGRRDVTLAVGHGKTILGSIPAFVSGSADVARRVAAHVLSPEPVALALTERAHGADLLASETRAERGAEARLHGEKWLINNAIRSTCISVFARTRADGGPRGFSLFFFEKEADGGGYSLLPKVRTHGIRGADISGIRFEGARCAAEPIGGEGAGLSVVLKTFAVTRTLIPSVAVGAADSALRIVLAFARSRALYGGTVLQIPHARAVLCDTAADLLACEAASLVGARILHAAPRQSSFWSSVLKYAVPTTIERLLGSWAVLLGSRHYLRESDGAGTGMFQKIRRDVAILSLFDGSTLVNLNNIAVHARAASAERGDLGEASATLLFPLPEFEPERLSIVSPQVAAVEDLALRARGSVASLGLPAVVATMLEQLAASARSTRVAMAELLPRSAFDMTPELVELSARYARLATLALAAAAAVSTPPARSASLPACDWLVLALARELPERPWPAPALEAARHHILEFLLAALDRGAPFSLIVPLET